MRPFRLNESPINMLECSLKLRPISFAEMPNPSVNDAVGGLINLDLRHDDAMVRDWWQDGRCRAIRYVRQNQIKKIIATSRFMHTLRDAFGYTSVLKDLTNAGITIRKPQPSSVMDIHVAHHDGPNHPFG